MFDQDGRRMPVTHIQTTPCYLVGIKTKDVNGYNAVKLGMGIAKKISKPQAGELKKAGIQTPLRFLREIRVKRNDLEIIEKDNKKGIKIDDKEYFVGDKIIPSDMFKTNDTLQVTGVSKGKGFQGVVKRHRFAGGPRTHGQSDRERAPGSIGQTTTPGRVYRGKRMAGRMGTDTVTVKNLTVIAISDDAISVKGLVPGAKNGLILINKYAN